jgi:hypothetical protein
MLPVTTAFLQKESRKHRNRSFLPDIIKIGQKFKSKPNNKTEFKQQNQKNGIYFLISVKKVEQCVEYSGASVQRNVEDHKFNKKYLKI